MRQWRGLPGPYKSAIGEKRSMVKNETRVKPQTLNCKILDKTEKRKKDGGRKKDSDWYIHP